MAAGVLWAASARRCAYVCWAACALAASLPLCSILPIGAWLRIWPNRPAAAPVMRVYCDLTVATCVALAMVGLAGSCRRLAPVLPERTQQPPEEESDDELAEL